MCVLALMEKHRAEVPPAKLDCLIRSGAALERYLQILKEQPMVLPHSAWLELFECCQRHLLYAQRAGVPMTPKHHLFVHLTWRIFVVGSV